MIEKVLYDYLDSKLSCPVFFEYPTENTPDEFVLIDRTGGSGFLVREARFAVQSYSTSVYKASLLNETVKGYMDEFRHEKEVSAVTLNADYDFTDVGKKKYRYQGVYDITY